MMHTGHAKHSNVHTQGEKEQYLKLMRIIPKKPSLLRGRSPRNRRNRCCTSSKSLLWYKTSQLETVWCTVLGAATVFLPPVSCASPPMEGKRQDYYSEKVREIPHMVPVNVAYCPHYVLAYGTITLGTKTS